jgi:hypothetical protein
VKRAWQQLQNAFDSEGKTEWLEVLQPFVAGGGKTPLSQEESRRKTWSSDSDSANVAFASASALSRSAEIGSGEHGLAFKRPVA